MEHKFSKTIYIINGYPTSGKDTLINGLQNHFIKADGHDIVLNVSSVDMVKKAGEILGCDSIKKSPEDRNFLSDLKALGDKYYNSSFTYVTKRIVEFMHDGNKAIMFIHIREGEQIDAVKAFINERYGSDRCGLWADCYTMLVTRSSVSADENITNDSDNKVSNYTYDILFDNSGLISNTVLPFICLVNGTIISNNSYTFEYLKELEKCTYINTREQMDEWRRRTDNMGLQVIFNKSNDSANYSKYTFGPATYRLRCREKDAEIGTSYKQLEESHTIINLNSTSPRELTIKILKSRNFPELCNREFIFKHNENDKPGTSCTALFDNVQLFGKLCEVIPENNVESEIRQHRDAIIPTLSASQFINRIGVGSEVEQTEIDQKNREILEQIRDDITALCQDEHISFKHNNYEARLSTSEDGDTVIEISANNYIAQERINTFLDQNKAENNVKELYNGNHEPEWYKKDWDTTLNKGTEDEMFTAPLYTITSEENVISIFNLKYLDDKSEECYHAIDISQPHDDLMKTAGYPKELLRMISGINLKKHEGYAHINRHFDPQLQTLIDTITFDKTDKLFSMQRIKRTNGEYIWVYNNININPSFSTTAKIEFGYVHKNNVEFSEYHQIDKNISIGGVGRNYANGRYTYSSMVMYNNHLIGTLTLDNKFNKWYGEYHEPKYLFNKSDYIHNARDFYLKDSTYWYSYKDTKDGKPVYFTFDISRPYGERYDEVESSYIASAINRLNIHAGIDKRIGAVCRNNANIYKIISADRGIIEGVFIRFPICKTDNIIPAKNLPLWIILKTRQDELNPERGDHDYDKSFLNTIATLSPGFASIRNVLINGVVCPVLQVLDQIICLDPDDVNTLLTIITDSNE